ISRDRMLFRENAEGRIENVYSLKVINKDQVDHSYLLNASGLPDLQLQGPHEIKVSAGQIFSLPVGLSSAPEKLSSSRNEVTFTLQDIDNGGTLIETKSSFLGPPTIR
ncbi:Iron-sulfur cluster-binding protein, partial [Pseudomonas cannabina]